MMPGSRTLTIRMIMNEIGPWKTIISGSWEDGSMMSILDKRYMKPLLSPVKTNAAGIPMMTAMNNLTGVETEIASTVSDGMWNLKIIYKVGIRIQIPCIMIAAMT